MIPWINTGLFFGQRISGASVCCQCPSQEQEGVSYSCLRVQIHVWSSPQSLLNSFPKCPYKFLPLKVTKPPEIFCSKENVLFPEPLWKLVTTQYLQSCHGNTNNFWLIIYFPLISFCCVVFLGFFPQILCFQISQTDIKSCIGIFESFPRVCCCSSCSNHSPGVAVNAWNHQYPAWQLLKLLWCYNTM